MANEDFEELKKQIIEKLPEGKVLDDAQMDNLKSELTANGNDISKIDVTKYYKDDEKNNDDSSKNKDGQDKGPTVISDHDEHAETPTGNEGNDTPVDDHWKEDFKREWRDWAEKNGKIYEESKIPDDHHDISFRLYDSKEKQENNEYAAEISYKGPRHITLKGRDGKAPDSKYFEQSVALAIQKNGPNIEFGNITTSEFKAKLLAACYLNGANPVGNVPTEAEMAQWPQNLQDMVREAKEKAPKNEENNSRTPTPEEHETPTKPEPSAAQKRIAELRKRIETRDNNLQEAREAASITGGELYDKDVQEIYNEGLTDEELKLRELRGQAKNGDKEAQKQLDSRRYNTMTDEYKYVREVEMEADGKTEKKDEKGKPVYKKDENGNFVYKTDENGHKIKSDAYQAFLTKAAQSRFDKSNG